MLHILLNINEVTIPSYIWAIISSMFGILIVIVRYFVVHTFKRYEKEFIESKEDDKRITEQLENKIEAVNKLIDSLRREITQAAQEFGVGNVKLEFKIEEFEKCKERMEILFKDKITIIHQRLDGVEDRMIIQSTKIDEIYKEIIKYLTKLLSNKNDR